MPSPEVALVSLFVLFLLLRLAAVWLLEALNLRELQRRAGKVPAAYADTIDLARYEKAQAYTRAKTRLGLVDGMVDAILLLLLLPTGILADIYGALTGLLGTGTWSQALVLLLIMLGFSVLGWPLELYAQFRVEAKYGFNRSGFGLWVTDKLKGLVLTFLLGLPLLALLLWLVTVPLWWLWAFVVLLTFQLVMFVLYPWMIMPWFNKFEPLPEGELRERLMALADRTGFQARSIQVMDGSKRSGHSNAFFTGFGRFRRIVLYDTLVDQLTPRQLEAVLAHEIGHYRLGHIWRMLIVSALGLLVGFAVLGWLAGSPWFVEAFGFTWTPGQLGPALLLFALVSGLVTFWLTPLWARLSRKHEYEADAFARAGLGDDPIPLIESLRKLHTENLSNLTPHPWYSAFSYSHPTLVEREKALRAGAPG